MGKIFERISQREKIRSERKDAVNRSRAVLGGQMTEQVAPFLPNFPCNPADVRFVGKPIDFVAFPGAAQSDSIQEVLFIEVKTGTSKLSEREKQIKAAVESGRVRYVVYRAE
ncbi:Holliday junction resolvase-like protein [Treponema zioleckii]|uniref:Holliday junction resolvase-like protein n=1 Tax=Treponema zioleckii TaxID=331680 RepID=UPI001F5B3D39|nr:Holliday junction resolvase-like protein [Treponema zioleckii]